MSHHEQNLKAAMVWRKNKHPKHFSTEVIAETVVVAETNSAETNSSATKHDAGKTEYCYLSPIAMEEICKVLTFGAKKYAPHNWTKGFKWTRVFSAAMRHLFAWLSGQDKDSETGLSHLAHAACCIMFLLEFAVTKPELDDRRGNK